MIKIVLGDIFFGILGTIIFLLGIYAIILGYVLIGVVLIMIVAANTFMWLRPNKAPFQK